MRSVNESEISKHEELMNSSEAGMGGGFRSRQSTVFLTKIWGPLILLGACFVVFGRDLLSWRFLLAVPLILAACFAESLAVVRLKDGILSYRRIIKWTKIAENEIVTARTEWPPFIGSLSLTKYVFPWGKLYFVLDGNSEPNPLRPGKYPLVDYISERAGQRRLLGAQLTQRNTGIPVLKLLMAAVVGAALQSFWYVLTPSQTPQPADIPYSGGLLRIAHLLGNFEVLLVLSSVFCLLTILRSRRPDAWIFAFLAGAGICRIALHWF